MTGTALVKDVEKISHNLQARHYSRVYSTTTLFIVYKTIESNPNITVNQLKHLLQQEYFIPASVIEGSVGALTTNTLFGSVTRFQRPGSKVDTSHLTIKLEQPPIFVEWRSSVLGEFPELASFKPPKYCKKRMI